MGKGPTLDRAITDFAEAYAKQNQRDYDRFGTAIDDGRLEYVDPATYDTKSAKPTKRGKAAR